MDIEDVLKNGHLKYLPNLSIDWIYIGYQNDAIKCLLLKLGDKWLLPGGYIKVSESVEEAAQRILKERINVERAHFRFLDVFGNQDRSFKEEFKSYFETNDLPWSEDYFINNRFVTLAYYSLVQIDTIKPEAGDIIEDIQWFEFDDLPSMWLDHQSIAEAARDRLKRDIQNELVTYNLLSESFTMPELHQLHQVILEQKIDRSRFQKKMLSSGLFERLPQVKKETPGRNPYLYRLNK